MSTPRVVCERLCCRSGVTLTWPVALGCASPVQLQGLSSALSPLFPAGEVQWPHCPLQADLHGDAVAADQQNWLWNHEPGGQPHQTGKAVSSSPLAAPARHRALLLGGAARTFLLLLCSPVKWGMQGVIAREPLELCLTLWGLQLKIQNTQQEFRPACKSQCVFWYS